MAFDLVHAGADLSGLSYERRRTALEALFADHGRPSSTGTTQGR
jgi:ATP-dependent DNA ligase